MKKIERIGFTIIGAIILTIIITASIKLLSITKTLETTNEGRVYTIENRLNGKTTKYLLNDEGRTIRTSHYKDGQLIGTSYKEGRMYQAINN